MQLSQFFKSIIDADTAEVVICDTTHKIIYMNPAAISIYEKRGGAALVGKNLLCCHNADSRDKIIKVLAWFNENPNNNTVHTFFSEKQNKDVYMIALRDEQNELIGYYEKHEYRTKDTRPLYEMN